MFENDMLTLVSVHFLEKWRYLVSPKTLLVLYRVTVKVKVSVRFGGLWLTKICFRLTFISEVVGGEGITQTVCFGEEFENFDKPWTAFNNTMDG